MNIAIHAVYIYIYKTITEDRKLKSIFILIYDSQKNKSMLLINFDAN